MSKVEYRELPDWQGYCVGSDGTVWSQLKSKCLSGENWGEREYVLTGEWVLKNRYFPSNTYETVQLSRDGFQKIESVHRIVLLAFIGPCPQGLVGCHNNGNPRDNRLVNLRWDTPKSNTADRKKHGTHLCGVECHSAKLTETDVLAIIEDLKGGASPTELAIKWEVSRPTINGIAFCRTWKHIQREPRESNRKRKRGPTNKAATTVRKEEPGD